MAHRGLHGYQLILEVNHLLPSQENLLINAAVAGYVRVLRQVANGLVLGQHHLPLIRLQLAHNNPKQGCLPCSVDAYNRRLLILLDVEGGVLYNFICAESLADALAR